MFEGQNTDETASTAVCLIRSQTCARINPARYPMGQSVVLKHNQKRTRRCFISRYILIHSNVVEPLKLHRFPLLD